MNFFKITILLLLSLNANGFDFPSVQTSPSSNINYFSSIEKDATDCIVSALTNGIQDFDICTLEDALNQLNTQVNKSLINFPAKFDIGGCSFSATFKPLECLKDSLRTRCSNSRNPYSKANLKHGLKNYISQSASELVDYGDDEILGNVCLSVFEKQSKVPKHVEVVDDVRYEDVLLTKDGGVYFNTRRGKNLLICIEEAKREGSDEKYCYTEYTGINSDGTKVEITELENKKMATKEATINQSSPLLGIVSNSRNEEITLKKNILDECKNSNNFQAAENCRIAFLKNKYNISEQITATKIDLSKNISGFSRLTDRATTPPITITNPTDYTLSKLPIEKKNDYISAASKYMAQQSLKKAYLKKISSIQKELGLLIYSKREMMSKPFFEKAAKKELGL